MVLHRSTPGSSLSELRHGAALPVRGLALLRKRRELWALAVLPVLLTAVAFIGAGIGIATWASEIDTWIASALPHIEAGAWYTWLWVGPGKVVVGVVRGLLFAAVAAAALVIGLLLAALLSSPALDALSSRVEGLRGGGPDASASPAGTLREMASSLLNEARRLLFFGLLGLAIWVLGIVIPGGAVVAPVVLVGVTLVFLPLEYAAYALDRRQVAFRERRSWLARNRALTLGFGAAALAVGSIPVLNLLALPALVVAGTLLVLERPPTIAERPDVARPRPGPDGPARSATSP